MHDNDMGARRTVPNYFTLNIIYFKVKLLIKFSYDN